MITLARQATTFQDRFSQVGGFKSRKSLKGL